MGPPKLGSTPRLSGSDESEVLVDTANFARDALYLQVTLNDTSLNP